MRWLSTIETYTAFISHIPLVNGRPDDYDCLIDDPIKSFNLESRIYIFFCLFD